MTILFIDCESSGKIKDSLPLSDPSQPWAVSIAAELCRMDGTTISHMHMQIRADGRMISEGAERVHGISNRQAAMSGVSEAAVIGSLIGLSAQAQIVAGHGVNFDKRLVEGVVRRAGKNPANWLRPGIQWFCTMEAATPFCRIKREDGSYKWPSLDEACETMLSLPRRVGHHSAWDDLQRMKALYFEIARQGAAEAEDGKPFDAPSSEAVVIRGVQWGAGAVA